MQSLFGLNLPQQQQAAPAFNPLANLSAMGAAAGASLRQNIAGAFGQQTPQQALSSIIQQTQQQTDLGTPEGLVELANNLNQFPQFSGIALAMRQEASKLAQESGLTSAKIFQAQAAGTASLAQAMREKEPKEPTKVGVSEDGQNVFLKGGMQFTISPEGQYIPFAGKIREGAGTRVELTVSQEADLIRQGQVATGDITKRVSAINRAITLNSQNSPFAGAAFKQEVASVFGDAQKAATEIQALANTGALDTRIANRITSFIEGKTTQTTKEDRDAVLKVLRGQSRDEYERTVSPFRAAVKTPEQGMKLFPSFEERYGMPKGLSKPSIPIPENQKANFTEGKRYQRGNKTYIVKNGQLVEE